MQIVHYFPAKFPVQGYGGTERIAYWLGKAQAEMGHKVIYLCKAGGSVPFAEVMNVEEEFDDLTPLIPPKTDIVQLYNAFPITDNLENLNIPTESIKVPRFKLDYPCLTGIHGNGKPSETFHPNSVFVSQNHAARHNWTEYVYNGIDISEYPIQCIKENFLLFLAKASWKVKNLSGSISIANSAKIPLHIAGGKASFWSRGVISHGTIDGAEKLSLLRNAQALLFPVIWEEPFGVALIEALACGTPIIATPRGAIPEIVDSTCGFLSNSFSELVESVKKLKSLDPEDCRVRVIKQFTHLQMAEGYLAHYRKILKDGFLREGYPTSLGNPQEVTWYKK